MEDGHYDLVVLGSGSTAFAAAFRAAETGKTAVMTEARTVGGTCVNRGCLPSKNLIEAAKLVYEARHPRYPGIEPCEVRFDFGELVRQKDELVSDYRQKRYVGLADEAEGIDVVRGRVAFVDDHAVEVDGRRIEGERFLVALGSSPIIPDIEGLDEVPYLTSDLLTSAEEMELFERPGSLVIVGGGYVALELGQMFSRFGSEVTILVRNDHVLKHGYEPQVGRALQEILREEGVKVLTGANVRRVRAEGESVLVEMRAVDHSVIPRAIFTDPQVGLVGLTEEEAIARRHRC